MDPSKHFSQDQPEKLTNTKQIAILDFGGQYAHLIANRIRRLGVHAVIKNHDTPATQLSGFKGIILSGGPQSVNGENALLADEEIFKLGIPVLGICYGHQVTNKLLGGTVSPGEVKEYGKTKLYIDKNKGIFTDCFEKKDKDGLVVWMSHWDEVTDIPVDFEVLAHTDTNAYAAVGNTKKHIYGIQFHPEVTHTEHGQTILKNFIDITGAEKNWNSDHYLQSISTAIEQLCIHTGKKVFMMVSGGVDSVVAFTLLNTVLGKDKVYGLLVDTGFMRHGEIEEVLTALKQLQMDNLHVAYAADDFSSALRNISDPEEKRAIIGKKFLDIQAQEVKKMGLNPEEWMLGQGTIYPDTIESGATKNADKIKTHHNRVPEIQDLMDKGMVIEPLKDLYKDEVRTLGEAIGLPHHLVWRHPFPGPGLAVRMLCNDNPLENQSLEKQQGFIPLPIKSVGVQGDARTYRHPAILDWNFENTRKNTQDFSKVLEDLEHLATQTINKENDINRCLVLLNKQSKKELTLIHTPEAYLTEERITRLQRADHIVTQKLLEMEIYNDVWQFPVVLAPMNFNGKGKESIILRPVNSIDAMTANLGQLPHRFFENLSQEILEDESISAVFLDVTSKPPGTIEWE